MLEELTAVATVDLPIRAFAEHLKLGSGFADDGSEDAVLEVCLRSAMAAIEVRIGKALMMRSFSWELTRWISKTAQGLPIAPVSAVNSVILVDGVGVETLVGSHIYMLERDAGRVSPNPNCWGAMKVNLSRKLVLREWANTLDGKGGYSDD